MPGDDVVPVHLVESAGGTAEPAAGPAAGREPDPSPAERRRRRAGLLAGLGLAAVLVVGAGVISLMQQREEAERQAALDALDWVLPPLEAPLAEAWRVPAAWPVATTDRLVVLADTEGLGSLTARDLGTGAVVWERRVTGPTQGCSGVAPQGDSDAAARASVPLGGVLVCVPATNDVRDRPVPGLPTRVVAVDPATGADLDGLDLPGSVLFERGVAGDVVVGYVHPDGALGLVRWAPAAGEVRWTYRGEPGLLPDGMFGLWGYRVTGDVLTFQGGVPVAVDLATGRSAEPDPRGVWLERHTMPDGGVALWRADADGVVLEGTVLGPEGDQRYDLPGAPWVGSQDDGSGADVLVVQRRVPGGLTGLDARTGEELWAAPGQYWGWAPLRLAGRVVAIGQGEVTALDVADGRVVWRREAAVTAPLLLTDGRLVLVPVTIRGTGYLAALELASGVEAWRVPAPAGVAEVVRVGTTVLLVGETEVAALRPASGSGEG